MAPTAASVAADKKKNGENVKVVVRCRPLNSTEKARNDRDIITVNRTNGSITVADPSGEGNKTFTFDYTYGADTPQSLIYTETAKPIVDSVLTGYNGTIFAYGQTGSGKTHTMEGVIDDPSLCGIMPNSFSYIFDKVSSSPPHIKYLIRASFLEVYMDDVFDLLNVSTRAKMEIKESKEKGVYVKDLSTYNVSSVADLIKVLRAGQKQRKVGATKMNEGSSRSHSILTVTVETAETLLPTASDAAAPASSAASTGGKKEATIFKQGKLNLVDLAGSERQKKTGAEGDRLDEANKINWSLTVLGNCISALIEPNSKHVPFRDSKLTRLLQDSLGGNTKTVMIANIGPSHTNWDETKGTLKYADRAKQIKNKPIVNADSKDALMKEMQDEILKLKEMLANRAANGGSGNRGGKISSTKSLTKMSKTELLKNINSLPKEMIEEQVVEKVIEKSTGYNEDHLLEIELKSKEETEAILRGKEKEKKRLKGQADMMEHVTNQAEEELQYKNKQLSVEEEEMKRIADEIEKREKSVLVGEGRVDLARKQQVELKKIEEDLRARRELQAKLETELAEAEQSEALMNAQYSSREEEYSSKEKKIKLLYKKYTERKNDLAQLKEEFESEKQELIDTVARLDEELKLKQAINRFCIPQAVLEVIERGSVYDRGSEEWRIRGIEVSGSVMRERDERERLSTAMGGESPRSSGSSGSGGNGGRPGIPLAEALYSNYQAAKKMSR